MLFQMLTGRDALLPQLHRYLTAVSLHSVSSRCSLANLSANRETIGIDIPACAEQLSFP
jgi:hypothetical protein